ncbi:hypothetical protein [Chamaesiphon sp. VAR_69_metabat_338]|uniref:hypothetical protein n=1 Tax=Chamaesiphon sp. VAR_69_metabat_338 TaxID=2964704 RepID=UPI00286DBCC0|nr:hypothetical protein [Chamaesiphon sp. VAR_69_metabat_338]
MTAINDGSNRQLRSTAAVERYNFMELADGEVDAISQAAVATAIVQKQAMGLPITIWNEGNPYRRYPDGRVEYIQL